MRRYLAAGLVGAVCSIGLVASASASESAASQKVDEIFARTLPGNRESAPPAEAPAAAPAPAPAPAASGPSSSQAAPQPRSESRVSIAAPAPAPAPKPAPAARPAPAPAPKPAPAASGPVRRVSSTAYCLTGRMASGRYVYYGAAAMNGVPLGARYRALDGPRAGAVFVIEDRIGHSSQFDIAYPGNCSAARQYGRRTISIQRV